MSSVVYAIGTMDSKGRELAFVADRIAAGGVPVVKVDVGTLRDPVVTPDIDRQQVAKCHPDGMDAVLRLSDRGQAVAAMSVALERFLTAEYAQQRVGGVIGLGGTGGTAMIAPAMQALPIGFPKLLVSTVAGANVTAYVGCSDLVMFPSIVDVAGLNSVSRRIFTNAAAALVGMVSNSANEIGENRPAIGMTMFGVTTACVDIVRKTLEDRGFDCLVFHATGVGGRSMENLVKSGFIQGVLDVTTTEVADEVVGGIFPSGSQRFDAILAAGIPYVISVGALDMVNFAAKETVPSEFRDRRLHVHNPNITLMRTTPEENRECARWIAAKLNRSTAPLEILIPNLGVSALDAPLEPFHDPQADEALFDQLESSISTSPDRCIRHFDLHINDREFANELVESFFKLWSARGASQPPNHLSR